MSLGFIALGVVAFFGLVWLSERSSILAAGAVVLLLGLLLACVTG